MDKTKILFQEPIMSGHYVWRSQGIKLVKNMYSVLNNELSFVGKVKNITCGSIIRINNYNNIYKKISNYKNVFSSTTLNYAIRPENTSILLKKLELNSSSIIMINTPLYREFQPKALLIDQRIWPALSFVMSTKKSLSVNVITKKVIPSINSFFDKILLPHLWVEQEDGFKKFANRMFLPLMSESSETITVASTMYVLSKNFPRGDNIINKEIIQYGFSGRIIYIYCIMQEDKINVVWPSCIAPIQVLMSKNAYIKIKDFLKNNIRYKVSIDIPDIIGEEGDSFCNEVESILTLFMKNGEIFYKVIFTNEVGKLTDFNMIQELLRKSDRAIFENNKRHFIKCLNNYRVEFLCKKCENVLQEFSSLGAYHPNEFSSCQRCGTMNSLKKILLPLKTRGSINEKIINKKTTI